MMFKIGHCRYFNCAISIKYALDSISHYDLVVLTTHLPRPDEPTDNSYEIVCEYIKNHPERKFIHEIYPHIVYPASHPYYKSNYPNINSVNTVSNYYNFGLRIIRNFIIENKLNYNDIMYTKIDSDIIELEGETFYKNNEWKLKNYITNRSPIIHYMICDDKTVKVRPSDFNLKRSDYFTLPGKILPYFFYKQKQLWEEIFITPSCPHDLTRVRNKLVRQQSFIHVAEPEHYFSKRGYNESQWIKCENYPAIINKIKGDYFKLVN